MTTEQEAIHTLYSQVAQEPYKTTSSWTRTREFKQDTIQRKPINQFVIDERFVTLARPDSYTRTQ
jgi:hypothetical protein